MLTLSTAIVLSMMAASVAPLALAFTLRTLTLAGNLVGFVAHTVAGLVSDFLAA